MHPVLFRIPIPGWKLPLIGKLAAIPIYSYGVMLGLSLVVGWYLTLGLAEKDGLDRDQMANCYVITAAMAVLGSRVLFLLTNAKVYHGIGDLFSFRGGGLVAYGGFLGGLVASYGYLRWKKKRLLPWADVAVPSLASGVAITRIGCYLFGCDYGQPLGPGAPGWLKALGTFPKWPAGTVSEAGGSPAWVEHVNRQLIEPTATSSLPVHPTQIYESLVGAGLLLLLLAVRRRQRFRGQVFFVATFGYGLLRFLLELVRDDPERGSLPFVARENVLIPLCLALFAAAFAVGIARVIVDPRLRKAAQALAFAPAILAAIALRPDRFAVARGASLSTSQFIGLASALVVAAMYAAHDKAADTNPIAAMAVDEPSDLPAPPPASAEDDKPKKDPAKPKKKKRTAKPARGDA